MSVARSSAVAFEAGATAVWVGASAGFAFVSAPLAFALVADRNVFAELTERSLRRLATLTYAAGGAAGAVALTRAGLEFDGRINHALRGAAAGCALLCIAYHQRAIVPAMATAQAALGRFADVAQDDPKRIAYRVLHKRSTRVYGTALLFGIIQFVFAVTRPNA